MTPALFSDICHWGSLVTVTTMIQGVQDVEVFYFINRSGFDACGLETSHAKTRGYRTMAMHISISEQLLKLRY